MTARVGRDEHRSVLGAAGDEPAPEQGPERRARGAAFG